MPWKNGLGMTTQLAIHPHDATTDAFEWRVSIAQLKGSAAFSLFHGIERCLGVLNGAVTLLRAGHAPLRMTAESQPVSFSGSIQAEGRVETGTALDLNLMYRPSQWRATMKRVKAVARTTLHASPVAMLCPLSATRADVGGERHELNRFDLLRVELGQEALFELANGFDGYVIELRERHS
jgi:uncharacterized protein